MSQETFRKLRQMLMEKLDVCQELTDQEILETIDELILDRSFFITDNRFQLIQFYFCKMDVIFFWSCHRNHRRFFYCTSGQL